MNKKRLFNKVKETSIRWKVFFYLIGFCLLLLVILWLFQTVFLESFYKDIKLRDIKAESAIIEKRIEEDDYDGLIEAVNARGDLYVEIWSGRLGTAMRTGNYPEGIQARLTNEFKAYLWQMAFASGEEANINHFSFNIGNNRKESILYSKMVQTQNTNLLLMVSANISPVDATVKALRIQLIYISGLMIVLSAILAFLIARKVSSPIEILNGAAKKLGSGKTDIEFKGGGYREISELAHTLDHTAKELEKNERLRQELIANVSHDLRTPLTLISGYGEMMRDIPHENTAANIQIIIDEAKRLTTLVNDLLDLSRLQSGTGNMNFCKFNLTSETRNILLRFSKFCEQEAFVITFEQDEEVWVNADPERIAQVIYNFLINAVNHSGEEKKVLVCQSVENGRVKISVKDTGEGIAPDKFESIWDRYYKVDTVHKRPATGTGLGLSIVKSILDQHPDVEYGVESILGNGSTFWFSLPRQ